MRAAYLALASIALAYNLAGAENTALIRLQVTGGDTSCIEVPMCAPIDVPGWIRVVPPSLLDIPMNENDESRAHGTIMGDLSGKGELWWIAPHVQANASSLWMAKVCDVSYFARPGALADHGPSWLNHPIGSSVLHYGDAKIVAYVRLDPYWERSWRCRKPFIHVYDDQQRLTNGPDGVQPYEGAKILDPNECGIFIGWDKLTFEGREYDFWHMKGTAQVVHDLNLKQAGDFLARVTSTVHWSDPAGPGPWGMAIIIEQRTITVYRLPDPTIVLLDLESQLKAVAGDVLLDGDPEHGGVQYRAHNDVATGPEEDKAQYLFHADGIDPRKDIDLPWMAMSYGLNGKRYCVQHMNHPANPKGTIHSAYRDYGRFGASCRQTIPENEILTLRYRFWVGRGETPTRETLAARYAAYANPPKVDVVDVQMTGSGMNRGPASDGQADL